MSHVLVFESFLGSIRQSRAPDLRLVIVWEIVIIQAFKEEHLNMNDYLGLLLVPACEDALRVGGGAG
jgi:hypothetical protein